MATRPAKRAKREGMDPRIFIADIATESESDSASESDGWCSSGAEEPDEYLRRRRAVDATTAKGPRQRHDYMPWSEDEPPEDTVKSLKARHTKRGWLPKSWDLEQFSTLDQIKLQATEQDNMWRVAVVGGHENDVLHTIMSLCSASKGPSGVLSALQIPVDKGSVYIECSDVHSLNVLIDRVFFMRRNAVPQRIGAAEMNSLLRNESVREDPTHTWVRYAGSGIYAGDLAWVATTDLSSTKLTLWMVPRIMAAGPSKRRGGKSAGGVDRPTRRLFHEAEVTTRGRDGKTNGAPDTKEEFHLGFLVIRDVPRQKVRDLQVGERAEEVEEFRSAPAYEEMVQAVLQHAEATNGILRIMRKAALVTDASEGPWKDLPDDADSGVRGDDPRALENLETTVRDTFNGMILEQLAEVNYEFYSDQARRALAPFGLEPTNGEEGKVLEGIPLCLAGQEVLRWFPRPSGFNFLQAGDAVRVLNAGDNRLLGRIVEIDATNEALVNHAVDEGSPNLATYPAAQLVANFETGDRVEVAVGRYCGHIGYLVNTKWETVTGHIYHPPAKKAEVPLNDRYPKMGKHTLKLATEATAELLEVRLTDLRRPMCSPPPHIWDSEREDKDLSVQYTSLQTWEQRKALEEYDNPPWFDESPDKATRKNTVRERYRHMEVRVVNGPYKGHFGQVVGSRDNGRVVDVVSETERSRRPIPFPIEDVLT
ncbi:hypothetical protein B0H10DRAFT_2221669 [Mycena sp. CBHHK59/15]|nr:hypothetical protein B0H10DRAFT_2221669 [Mycena sp. CBHHK59/15]